MMETSLLNNNIVLCDNAFTSHELKDIQNFCYACLPSQGVVQYMTGDPSVRKSDTMWLPRTLDTRFLYTRIATIARTINEKYFHFDLTGYIDEGILYLDYNQQGDHYDWHIDNSQSYRGNKDPVKLIVILQLSDPSEYCGGDAEIAGTGITVIPKRKGLIYAIPGYTAHRVTPLLSGRRTILSSWFTGPAFK